METNPTTSTSRVPREFTGTAQEVRAVLDEVRNAVITRNVDRILEFYDKDARLFDVRDTLQHRDLASYRAYWEECFRSAKTYGYDLHDVEIDVSGDMAVCSMFSNCRGTTPDESKIESWLRVTDVLRKQGGSWKVVHEHVSVPGDFLHGKLLENLRPGEEVNQDQHKH